MKDFDRETFHGLESLRILRANEMQRLTRVKEAAFKDLINLERLYMGDNPGLRFVHPDAFDGALAQDFKLRHLHLQGNKLRYLPRDLLPHPSNWAVSICTSKMYAKLRLKRLFTFQDLTDIDLENNPWACDCHNQWLTGGLAQQIKSRTPELADKLICGGPGDLRGIPMLALDLQPQEVPCPTGDNFNPYKENFGVSPHPKFTLQRLREAKKKQLQEEEDDEMENHDRLAVGVAITSLTIIGLAACFVGALYLRRRRQQRYRSLNNVRFGAAVGGVAEVDGASMDGYRDTGEMGGDANHDDIVRRVGGQ